VRVRGRLLILAVLALAGCHKYSGPGGLHQSGRFLGIGIYPAGVLWPHLVRNERSPDPRDPRAATLEDDSELIVTIDSRTGEVRQCGNLSGYCISSNPWNAQAGASPAILTEHAADLEKAARTEATTARPGRKQSAAETMNDELAPSR